MATVTLTDLNGHDPQPHETEEAGAFRLVIDGKIYERSGTAEDGTAIYRQLAY